MGNEIDLKAEVKKLMDEFGEKAVLDAIEKIYRLELLKAAAERMNMNNNLNCERRKS